MSSHHRIGSTDRTGATDRTSTTETSTRQEGNESEDPVNLVYRAIVDNPDFINRLADVLRANPGGLRGPRGPAGAVVTTAADSGHWRADEVGFFFPDLHSSYGASEIVTIRKDSFYCNAVVFLDRLDDIVRLKGGDSVRNNLSTCLRGAALQWYTTELSDIEKASLRSPSATNPQDHLHRWRIQIKRRWDPPVSVALQNFMNTRYTPVMVQSGVSVVQYFSTKLRLAKEAGFDNVHQQLLAVWNGIDVSIQEFIDEPEEDTSIDRFRKTLENKEHLWREKLIQQRLRAQGGGTRWSASQRAPMHNMFSLSYDGPIQSSERPFLPTGQYQRGNGNARSFPQNAGNSYCPDQGRIGPPPQRFQITAGLSSTTSESAQRRSSAWSPGRRTYSKCGGQHMDWEHAYYQSNPSATSRPPKAFYLQTMQHGMGNYSQDDFAECIAAYHAAEDEETVESPRSQSPDTPRSQSPGFSRPPMANHLVSYENENQAMDYPSVGGSSWFEGSGEDQSMYDVYNHNMVGEIPGQSSPLSPLLLRRPVLSASALPSIPTGEAKLSEPVQLSCRFAQCGLSFPSRNQLHRHLQGSSHFTAESPIAPSQLSVRIIKPTKRPSLGTGYSFHRYRYAEVQVRSSADGEDHWICADSGCGMSVADELWFREVFPKAHVANMPVPIRIKGIASDAHMSNLYSVIRLFVPGQSKGEPVLVEMELELHLVQGLNCHMLVGIDILSPYGISLDFGTSLLRIPSCDTVASIRVKALEAPAYRKVKVLERTVVVAPYSRRAEACKRVEQAENRGFSVSAQGARQDTLDRHAVHCWLLIG
jgi:hypothetical protein